MADNNYPLPGFHFSVDLGGVIMNCSEVSGLDMELEEISYRDGAEQTFGTQKMSGLRKGSDVEIKKGVFADDKDYYEWFNEVAMNTPVRKDVTISLLDEEHTPVMTWKLINAWPKKISGPSLKSDGNDVAIESMTIVHEGITIE
jgi:phage tail-like protein|tara:strand:+ start:138 stop:569 length:432 start_codon:yes stop_codon:yes gene_type:complete